MTTTTNGNGNGNGAVAGAQFRMVALSRIRVREGFNPRGDRDPERVAQMNGSVAHEGVLTPIIVTPDDGDYVLVAGEGRYNAAIEASQVEVPVIVRDVDERTHGLEIAMAENLAREQLDPAAEARGFGGLREAQWSVKAIADYFGMTQAHVKRRLQILELDEQLHARVSDGTIPLGAVPALAQLARVHRELPVALAGRVGVEKRGHREPLSWATVTRDPIGSVIFAFDGDDAGLPPDVYLAGEQYPISRFTLDEKAEKDLAAYAKLVGEEHPKEQTVAFRISEIEQAKALGAAHANEYDSAHIIIGQDVADQLVCDRIAESLKATRQLLRRQREMEKQAATVTAAQAPAAPGGAPSPEDAAKAAAEQKVAEEEAREQRRREREERERQRQEAEAFNGELGRAVFKHLSRVKVDAEVLKLLASVEFAQVLPELAARGMRYGYPGWPIEPEPDAKSPKRTYLSEQDAGERASQWLGTAQSPAEIAGRLISMLAMARYARQEPLDGSSSYFHWDYDELLPWGEQLLDLIDAICKERLPVNLTKTARRELADQRAKARREEREHTQAAKRLEGVEERFAQLTRAEREQALEDAKLVHGFGAKRFLIERLMRETPLPDADEPEEKDKTSKPKAAETQQPVAQAA